MRDLSPPKETPKNFSLLPLQVACQRLENECSSHKRTDTPWSAGRQKAKSCSVHLLMCASGHIATETITGLFSFLSWDSCDKANVVEENSLNRKNNSELGRLLWASWPEIIEGEAAFDACSFPANDSGAFGSF